MSKAEQLPLCPELEIVIDAGRANGKALRRKKEKWQKAFQAYSDKMSQDGTTASGKCGYMDFCDYCTDNSYGRPCVRAFGKWARANKIQVDYDDFDFSKYI